MPHRTAYNLLPICMIALLLVAYLTGPAVRAQRDVPSDCKCPMTTGLAGLSMHVDSPAALLAHADELDLDLRQIRQLEEIEATARQQARKLLSDRQWEQVSKAPQGKLSMNEMALLGMKGKKG